MPQFNAEERKGRQAVFALAANEKVFEGEIGVINVAGAVVAATAAAGLKAFGRIESVEDGKVTMKKGCFKYQNSSSDALSAADIGSDCYIADSCTVCKTATGKSKAGKVFLVEDSGVWVDFN